MSVLTQYEDDTTLILDGSREFPVYYIKALNVFNKVSGLSVNYSKSPVLKIRSLKKW